MKNKSLDLPLQQEINHICLKFEDEWLAGRGPAISDYLSQASAVTQESLLRELILLDDDYRRERGCRLAVDDYVAQLPTHESTVRDVFFDLQRDTTPGMQSQFETSKVVGSATPRHEDAVQHPKQPLDQAIVGRYRLEERLGDGGFGVVYRATDTELHRDVAIKIPHGHLLDGALDGEIFRAEARTVAELDHPNIVPVYDIGRTSDDRVYFVMKYLPDRDYSQQIATGKIHPREVARQFGELADALAYAHSKGIIHRDIKPGNILIENVNKLCLVDFGLAARIGEGSRAGGLVGTPAYMSPEQSSRGRMAVTERSDIYGLGATFYHALTGQIPVAGATSDEILRRVQSAATHAAATDKAVNSRDLETICLKCLEKDPDQRYATSIELADDLQRFLRHEPIKARPIGGWERTWRWVARRPALAGVLALVAVILLASPIVAIVMNGLRLQALEQTARAEKVTRYMVEAFRSPDPDRDGKTITVYELLERAVADLEEQFQADPLLNAQFALAIGETFQNLEVPADAIPVLERARDHYQQALGRGDPRTLNAMYQLAEAHLSAGKLEEASALFHEVVQLMRLELGADHPDTLTATNGLAKAHFEAGRYDESLPLLEETLELRRVKFGMNHVDTLTSLNNLGRLHSFAGRHELAILLLEEALELRRLKLGRDHRHTLATQQNLAAAYIEADRGEEGLALMKEALEMRRAALGEDHGDTLNSKWRVAMYYDGVGRVEDALLIMEQVLQSRRAKSGDAHPGTLSLMQNLGNEYRSVGRLEESRAMLRQALDLAISSLGEEHPTTLATMHSLALACVDEKKFEEGVKLLERLVELGTINLGADHPKILGTMSNLGMVYRAIGRLDDSVSILEQAHSIAVDELGQERRITRMTKEQLDLTNQELRK